MTVDEIFSQLISHMVEGLMIQAQLSDYYGFLGMAGYQECHRYHFFTESKNYRDLMEYYISHYNKIPTEDRIDNPDIIPESWYQYSRQDVNSSIRINSIQIGMDKWVDWEKKTKVFYEQMFLELTNLKEIAASVMLKKYIQDVDKELAEACQERLEASAIDFNASNLVDDQNRIYKKYKKKLKEIKLC